MHHLVYQGTPGPLTHQQGGPEQTTSRLNCISISFVGPVLKASEVEKIFVKKMTVIKNVEGSLLTLKNCPVCKFV